jgi:hypothetical protein
MHESCCFISVGFSAGCAFGAAYSRHGPHLRTKPGCSRRSASKIKCYFNFGRAMRACLNRQRARLYLKTGAGTRVLRTPLLKPRRGIFTCPARSKSPFSYFAIMRGARNWRRSRRQSNVFLIASGSEKIRVSPLEDTFPEQAVRLTTFSPHCFRTNQRFGALDAEKRRRTTRTLIQSL